MFSYFEKKHVRFYLFYLRKKLLEKDAFSIQASISIFNQFRLASCTCIIYKRNLMYRKFPNIPP